MENLVSWWCSEEWIISCMQVCFCYIEGYDLTIVCFGTCGCVALRSFFVLIMLGSASFHSFVLCKFCFLGWCGDLDSMGLGYVHFIITVGIFLSGWLFCKVQIYIVCHVMAMHICYVWKTSCYSLLVVRQATHQHMFIIIRQAGRQGGSCVNISIFLFLLSSFFKVPFITWY